MVIRIGMLACVVGCGGAAEPGGADDPAPAEERSSNDIGTAAAPDGGAAPSLPTTDGVPTSPAALDAFLQTRGYTSWTKESAPHRSTGPHGSTVLTWVNPALEASLAAGNAEHPAGASSVKEFLTNGEVSGWAVSVKVDPRSDGGRGWYWYETFDASPGARANEGRGNPTCIGCHALGKDEFRTPYPLR